MILPFPTAGADGGVSCQVAPGLRGCALRTPRGDGRGQDLRWRLREQRAGHAPWPYGDHSPNRENPWKTHGFPEIYCRMTSLFVSLYLYVYISSYLYLFLYIYPSADGTCPEEDHGCGSAHRTGHWLGSGGGLGFPGFFTQFFFLNSCHS